MIEGDPKIYVWEPWDPDAPSEESFPQDEAFPKRRALETIVFVHHFGGSHRSTLRHIRLCNQLGYRAVSFDLEPGTEDRISLWPVIGGDLRLGLRHLWTAQIANVLNRVDGPKILYTFSSPSMSAFEAAAERRAFDIKGIICEGGPFFQVGLCTWNLLSHHYQMSSTLRKLALIPPTVVYLAGLHYETQLKQALRKLPARFPILSIRGWQDELVPPSAIEAVFKDQDHLDLEVLSLPEVKHLDGLLKASRVYRERVKAFLKLVS